MSRNMYPDNSKKWLILTKGRLQKELEDFGLNAAVVPSLLRSQRLTGGRPSGEAAGRSRPGALCQLRLGTVHVGKPGLGAGRVVKGRSKQW